MFLGLLAAALFLSAQGPYDPYLVEASAASASGSDADSVTVTIQ